LAALFRASFDHWSKRKTIQVIIWLWIWLFTWLSLAPSLRWPFQNPRDALLAISIYIGGAIIIPLLIGVTSNTKRNEFWQENGLAEARITRLYTYQGAMIGFHLGYFILFILALIGYYVHFPSITWIEIASMGLPIGSGYTAARLVPYNLWQAYGRLTLAKGWPFFIYALLGPLWGFWFFYAYKSILNMVVGPLALLMALTVVVFLQVRRHHFHLN
jgi:hypothetical protein